uniref:Large ribosomal subunit protein bL33c n=10 Tax=Allium TaxID=4678 RepID=A0A6M8TRB5_9ASPA|nr:ribosomal protein L33 [Allium nanodes]
MAKGKDVRVRVILECTSCAQNGVNKKLPGISRYITQKNRHNTPSRLDLRKFCRYCHKHTIHGEIKKYIEWNIFFSFLFFSSSYISIRVENRRIKSIKNLKEVHGYGKDVRVRVILECTSCAQNGVNKKLPGISRYITQKNRHNTPSRLDLRKFCRYCHKHTIHGEIKK